jgi:protein involved in polysaccharide export with SLBB domain
MQVKKSLVAMTCFVALGGITLPAVHAQAPVAAVASDYKVKAGDTISIQVLNHPEFSIAGTRVQNDNTISYFFGPIVVTGKTISEIGKLVTKQLVEAKQLVSPIVSVSVAAREPMTVNIYGDVRNAGKVELRDGMRLLDVLALAGGLPSDRYEFYKLVVYRPSGAVVVEVTKLYTGDSKQNIALESGDNIIIDEADPSETMVRVVGEVRSQSSVVIPRDGSILAVLNAAGGVTPTAALSQASIVRKGQTIKVDLRGILETGIVKGGFKLEAGDVLVIPQNKKVFRTNGAIQKTGEIIYPDDRSLTLFEALSIAGLPAQNADLKNVRLTRKLTDGKDETTTHNVEVMLKGNLAKDVAVKPDDSIFVEPKSTKKRFSLQDALWAVTTITGLLRLFR